VLANWKRVYQKFGGQDDLDTLDEVVAAAAAEFLISKCGKDAPDTGRLARVLEVLFQTRYQEFFDDIVTEMAQPKTLDSRTESFL
jgi:hypothetical protein